MPARRTAMTALLGLACLTIPLESSAAQSTCFGKTSAGRLEQGVRLPSSGPNFSSYSTSMVAVGRTYVHSKVARVVRRSFAALEKSRPETVYVIGESGWAKGGRFRPHRTHQNGLSVDFMVPVLNADGRSVPLPTRPTQRWGYDLEFDQDGRLDALRIDFDAVAAQLAALHRAARAEGVGIGLVIFDDRYLDKLWKTPDGPYVRRRLPFMKGKPWVRHDEHFHIDFVVPCKPL
jgi:penicillin-insensitive murein endopeptidase